MCMLQLMVGVCLCRRQLCPQQSDVWLRKCMPCRGEGQWAWRHRCVQSQQRLLVWHAPPRCPGNAWLHSLPPDIDSVTFKEGYVSCSAGSPDPIVPRACAGPLTGVAGGVNTCLTTPAHMVSANYLVWRAVSAVSDPTYRHLLDHKPNDCIVSTMRLPGRLQFDM